MSPFPPGVPLFQRHWWLNSTAPPGVVRANTSTIAGVPAGGPAVCCGAAWSVCCPVTSYPSLFSLVPAHVSRMTVTNRRQPGSQLLRSAGIADAHPERGNVRCLARFQFDVGRNPSKRILRHGDRLFAPAHLLERAAADRQ